MKTQLSIPLVLALALAGGTLTAPSGFATGAAAPPKVFISKSTHFSMAFPEAPKLSQQSLPTGYGTFQMYTYSAASELLTYAVIAAVAPKAEKTSPQRFLDGMQKGLLKTSKATVLNSRPVNLGGAPGRELQLSLQDGKVLARAYLYFTPKISYQVMAVGKKEDFQASKAELNQVMGSFRIAGK